MKLEAKKKIDWGKLREAYFNECTDKIGNTTSHALAPHDLFEWFKKEINEYEKI